MKQHFQQSVSKYKVLSAGTQRNSTSPIAWRLSSSHNFLSDTSKQQKWKQNCHFVKFYLQLSWVKVWWNCKTPSVFCVPCWYIRKETCGCLHVVATVFLACAPCSLKVICCLKSEFTLVLNVIILCSQRDKYSNSFHFNIQRFKMSEVSLLNFSAVSHLLSRLFTPPNGLLTWTSIESTQFQVQNLHQAWNASTISSTLSEENPTPVPHLRFFYLGVHELAVTHWQFIVCCVRPENCVKGCPGHWLPVVNGENTVVRTLWKTSYQWSRVWTTNEDGSTS